MALIGIDLGTTNSLGVVYREGRAELIPNRFGSFLTPSVVSVDENGAVITGAVAKERLITHPERTVASFKKFMGTKETWDLGGRKFTAEELSSFVVRSVVEDAERYLGEKVDEAVISVPAYFHDRQRTATKKAGALAGVQVNRIINEPSAAALASYFDTDQEQLFLVFDFGGGTLDVSIVDCFDTMVEIVSVSGDNRLGGDNFHDIMAESFLREHPEAREHITERERAVLRRAAEKCKQELTRKNEAVMRAAVGGADYESIYTNRRLMEESGEILERIRKVLTHALTDGGFGVQDIAAVVMVGGSSKMPMIQSYIQHLFHMAPMVTGNCDETVARGLGVVCGVMQRRDKVKDFVLTDICPFTLGTDTNNEADPAHPYMTPVIERNTVLPCSRVRRFYTARDNQTKVDISILQGEQVYAEDNMKLGVLSLNVPKKKKGEEAVDVRFTYDINGILIAEVTSVSTGRTMSKVISENMSEAEIRQRMKELEKLKIHPKDVTENKYVMERLKALYEESPVELRENLQRCIEYFDQLLNRQNPRPIKRYREYLEGLIEQLESYDPFAVNWESGGYEEDDGEDETGGDGWSGNGGDEEWEEDAPGGEGADTEDNDIYGRNGMRGNKRWTS